MKPVKMTKDNTSQHKRLAAGEPVTGMKDGGGVTCAPSKKQPVKDGKKGK